MSSVPIKKQPISLIFLLSICLSMLFGTAANGIDTHHVSMGSSATRIEIPVRWAAPPHRPLGNVSTSWRVSPNNESVTLDHAHRTDANGLTWAVLNFHENACGTYLVTMWLPHLPPGWAIWQTRIVHWKSCPTVLSLSSSDPPSPPPVSKLVKLSDDNQVTRPGDSVTFTVEFRDPDGNPIPGADLNFIFYGDPDTASLDPETTTTDANGRAQTTFTLSADAEGEYTVEAYSSQNFGIYANFTVTVDTSLPKATRLEKISGSEQTGFTGEPLTNPFVVQVRDQYNDPLEGVTVTFRCHSRRRLVECHHFNNRPRRSGENYTHPRHRTRHQHRRGNRRRYLSNGGL